jgi:hypothetical protein
MRSGWIILVAGLWGLSACEAGAAIRQPPQEFSSAALPARLLADAADGQWQDLTVLEAALVASGVEHASELQAINSRFAVHVERLRQESRYDGSQRDQAVSIQRYLHRELLTGPYDASCNDLKRTLSEGRYNCVTATVLFLAFAEQLELPLTAVHLPGHVRCRLLTHEPLEIETTATTVQGAIMPTQSLAAAERGRVISATALIGKLYYNDGLARMAQGDVDGAVESLQRSIALDPHDRAARENLLAALNNGALLLGERQQFAAASRCLARVRELSPDYAALAANDLHVHGQWVAALCEQREFAQALDVLTAGAQRQPQAPLYREGHVAVYRLWVEDLLERGESHAALAKVTQALARWPGDPRLVELQARVERQAAPR